MNRSHFPFKDLLRANELFVRWPEHFFPHAIRLSDGLVSNLTPIYSTFLLSFVHFSPRYRSAPSLLRIIDRVTKLTLGCLPFKIETKSSTDVTVSLMHRRRR